MGCGKARFDRKGKKTPKIENFGLKGCFLGPRGRPHMRPWGNLRWDLEATQTDLKASRTWDLEATCDASRSMRVAFSHCGLPRGYLKYWVTETSGLPKILGKTQNS